MKKFNNYHTRLLCLLVCMLLTFMVSACGSNNAQSAKESTAADDTASATSTADTPVDEAFLDSLKDKGYIDVGIKKDVPGLGYYDEANESWTGLEVELAYKTAAQLFDVSLDEAKDKELVHLTAVTVADRESKLTDGSIDLMLATFTITEERESRYAFSESYYTDYIGLMVRSSGSDQNSLGSADINSIANLDGKYIGVPRNATTRDAFISYIETMNTVKPVPIFCEFESYDALFTALKEGKIDVMSVDVSILNGYVDKTTKILDVRFGSQRYGAAVLPANRELLEYVNLAIAE